MVAAAAAGDGTNDLCGQVFVGARRKEHDGAFRMAVRVQANIEDVTMSVDGSTEVSTRCGNKIASVKKGLASGTKLRMQADTVAIPARDAPPRATCFPDGFGKVTSEVGRWRCE